MSKLYPWAWLYCTDYRCGHGRAIPFQPWAIRWGTEGLKDRIQRQFYCSRCGTRGAIFGSPHVTHEGYLEPFPSRVVTIGGRRRDGESCTGADARNRAEYFAKYPSGDALGEFRGGPPGP